MKYFLDTEFSERGNQYPVTLISIGIVSEDGREFYAASSNYSDSDCNDWVRENVLPHVGAYRQPLDAIAAKVRDFVGVDKPEFWGYYCDYDWVVFAQMFGTMMDLPDGWPMYCRDLKQLCDESGNPELPKQVSTEHNALDDARWNLQVYNFLTEAA
jgi:hypothetical protein